MNRTTLLPIIFLSLVSSQAMANKPNAMPNSNTSTTNNYSNQKNNNGKNNMAEHKDAIEVIMLDHNYIRQMFSQLDQELNSDVAKSRATFKNLKDFIVKHETMEQKVWYPELEKHAELKGIINDLKKEEKDASDAIKKLDGMKNDQEWVDGVRNFKTAVDHHANEEETKLFPKVKDTVSKDELNSIGQKLMRYHDQNKMTYGDSRK